MRGEAIASAPFPPSCGAGQDSVTLGKASVALADPSKVKDLPMYHKRRDAAQNVLNHLKDAEAAIDEAVTKVASLAACMPTSRIAANLAAEVGHEALANAMGACQSLVEARARIVETHQSLAATSVAIGLPLRAFGPLEDKESARLQVVESQAA